MAYVEEMNDNKILCILKELKHVNNFDNDITLNGYISYISKKDVSKNFLNFCKVSWHI